jgi:hypothetical protein
MEMLRWGLIWSCGQDAAAHPLSSPPVGQTRKLSFSHGNAPLGGIWSSGQSGALTSTKSTALPLSSPPVWQTRKLSFSCGNAPLWWDLVVQCFGQHKEYSTAPLLATCMTNTKPFSHGNAPMGWDLVVRSGRCSTPFPGHLRQTIKSLMSAPTIIDSADRDNHPRKWGK